MTHTKKALKAMLPAVQVFLTAIGFTDKHAAKLVAKAEWMNMQSDTRYGIVMVGTGKPNKYLTTYDAIVSALGNPEHLPSLNSQLNCDESNLWRFPQGTVQLNWINRRLHVVIISK